MEIISPYLLAPFCGSFNPGHSPHWIQLNRSGRDEDHPPQEASLLEVRGDGTFLIVLDDAVSRFWHHHPARLRHLAATASGRILIQPTWSLLWVHGEDGVHCFSVTNRDEGERSLCE